MPDFFIGRLPDVLYHGSVEPLLPGKPCLPASQCSWWREMDWDDYDGGREGVHRTAYANIVWEFLGLRSAGREDAPAWTAGIEDMAELSQAVGIFFVTDNEDAARSRYGPVHAIDMSSPDILDVAEDPNPGTYRAWIVIMRAGSPLPLAEPHAPRP